MRIALALVLLFLTAGCGESPAPKAVTVPLSEVAPELVEVAKKRLPDVKFDSARKKKFKGQDVIEIQGKQANGKRREVEVTLSGEIVEVE